MRWLPFKLKFVRSLQLDENNEPTGSDPLVTNFSFGTQ